LVLPQDWKAAWRGVWVGALPQLPLTLANAVILTALLAREMFPTSGRVTERRLALTTGAGNLLLAPFGAMPMCHGAGGLVAQYRFGARTGWAPGLLGAILLVLGLGFAGDAAALLGAIPLAAVGAQGTRITAVALNDYRTEIPAEDATRHDVIVARLMNNRPMRIREKGPLFIVYPFDTKAELRSELYYNRAAWQLNALRIR
jgi:hypothetical protein